MDQDKQDKEEYCLKIIHFFTKKRGSKDYEENKLMLLLDLLKNLKQLMEQKSRQLEKFLGEAIIQTMRYFLNDSNPQLRQNGLKFFRYLIQANKISNENQQIGKETTSSIDLFFELLIKKHIPYFISRSLERDLKEQKSQQNSASMGPQQPSPYLQEVIQSLKLTRKWIELSCNTFPKIIGNSLVAFIESSDVQFRKAGIEIIRLLGLGNPVMCGYCGGFQLLLEAILDPQIADGVAEGIIFTVLYLINETKWRSIVRNQFDVTRVFAVFTDMDVVPSEKTERQLQQQQQQQQQQTGGGMQQFEVQLQLAKKALIIILKSWTGLIYLGNERTALKSLIAALKQPIKPIVRQAIYEILGQLLSIGLNPKNRVIDLSTPHENGILVFQNLLNYYLIMLLDLMVDCGLFITLLELSVIEDQEISGPAMKYLKQISSIMLNLLPNSERLTDFLVIAAEQNDTMLTETKAKAVEVLHTMGNSLFHNESLQIQNSPQSFLISLCYTFSLQTMLGCTCFKSQSEPLQRVKIQQDLESDESKFMNNVKGSLIAGNKDPGKWNWQCIGEVINVCSQNYQKLIELNKGKVLRRLIKFYYPTKKQFVQLEWKKENLNMAKLGYQLIKVCEKWREGSKYIKGLVMELSKGGDELSGDVWGQRMGREVVGWVGALTESKWGADILNDGGFWKWAVKMVETKTRDHVVMGILYALNYDREARSREFLGYCMEKGGKGVVKGAIDLLRVLFEAESSEVALWGVDLLVAKLYAEEDISLKALEVIQQICREEELMNYVVQKWPKLITMGETGNEFLISILAVQSGFDYLTNVNNWTQKEIESWMRERNAQYVQNVEKNLSNALDFVSGDYQQTGFRFPELATNADGQFQLGLVQRIPWCIFALYESQEFEGILQYSTFIDYDQKNLQFILTGLPSNQQAEIVNRTLLDENSQFVIKVYLSIGKTFIDNNCREIQEPHYIRCDFNDKVHLSIYKDSQYIIEKNGIFFIFEHRDNKIRLIKIKIHFQVGEVQANQEKLPLHLFGELVKTKDGLQLLKQLPHFHQFVYDILNPCTILQKRSALWALGHIGRSKRGVKMLIENNVISQIMNMAQADPCLSIRGTCIYVLNMLASTERGRKELEANNWITDLKAKTGWICKPQNIQSFYSISESNEETVIHWPLQQSSWTKFYDVKMSLKLNEEQQRVLDCFAMLSNSLVAREAREEIKKIHKASPELFLDKHIVYSILNLMIFYKFRADVRKHIYMYLDKFLQQTNVFTILDQTQCFNKFII